MATCPNKNLDSWKNLVLSRGENVAYALWDMYDGNVPESESRESIVKAELKSINALQTDKAVTLFSTLDRNKVKGDVFWKKVQETLQIPKEQIELLKQYNTTNREELVTNMLADYSYTIEINTAVEIQNIPEYNAETGEQLFIVQNQNYRQYLDGKGNMNYTKNSEVIDENEYKKAYRLYKETEFKPYSIPSSYYSNLTVPGGTNYTENEIATPQIIPSIKGHGQFATDKGIGWFRSDIKIVEGTDWYEGKGEDNWGLNKGNNTPTKTRRILEVQSDYFQKLRNDFTFNGIRYRIDNRSTQGISYYANGIDITKQEYNKIFEEFIEKGGDNQFLALLHKGDNWVTFFVKSIIQDSAKKGYEKVLFPSGNTASKVEGHTTLEEFKKQKENRIKELEKELISKERLQQIEDLKNKKPVYKREQTETAISDEQYNQFKELFEEEFDGEESNVILNPTPEKVEKILGYKNPSNIYLRQEQYGAYVTLEYDREIIEFSNIRTNEQINNEINQLKQELERVEKEGFAALRPIYNFYENTVTNILKKQGYSPKVVTDEYGNTWNEITLNKQRDREKILFQLEEMPASKASAETIKKVKQILEKMGVSIKNLVDYAKERGLDVTGINGVADIVNKIIAVAEGKEEVTIVEEMVHIATAILEQKNPNLVTEMISKIDRFAIYKRTLDEYKDNPAYQLPNGKPNIRKIKKEAVDKLIAELIIYNSEGTTEFPELMNETDRSTIRVWWEKILDWFRGMYKKANIDIFQEAAGIVEQGVEGEVIGEEGLYYQLSDPQKDIQQRILQTQQEIRKVEDKKATEPILMDTEEASNWYEAKQPDGTWKRVTKRVTDRVKSWYRKRFPGKIFTEEEKAFNEFKRQFGVKGHKFFEEIHGRYFNTDGTRKKNAEPRATKLSDVDEQIYDKLENYYTKLIAKFSEGGKNPLVLSEVVIYDPKEKEAGTIDLLIVEENGKSHIIDWKFMNVAASAKDVAWYKQGAYNVQLSRYKDILRDRYGIKEIGMNRAIPILMEIKHENIKDKKSPLNVTGILIGSVNTEEIEDLRLIPVSEETESTGYERLDKLISLLNATYKQISKKIVTEEDEQEFKRDRLNILKEAIRTAQGTLNIAPLVDVIKIMRKEGQQILDDYNTIYKDRPANSKGEDFTDEKLSEMAANMREYKAFADVFGRIDDLIGSLIYNKDMEKEATTEDAKADVAMRKDLLNSISAEAREIRFSAEQIGDVSGKFADKFIGQKNLVKGLLSPEAIVKGLSATFRGVSELPMASLQLLYKIVTNAKGKASRDALGEVEKLMAIREKLINRGGDVRKLVQQIYQKDDKNKPVNKLIYKFDKKFFNEVDNNALEGNHDKNWLMANIDVEAYKKEASELLNKKIERIQKLHDDNPELMERLIDDEQRKWNIDRKDFTGWSNYIVKRHPLTKWYSEDYKNLLKDPDLLELYNFIVEINAKAKSSGYIGNKVASTFLPFVRKGMAESLAWDFDLSAITNFGKNLKIQADDVGYGQTNELTGELEDAVPKYYTYDFTRGEDGVNDYSDVSEDIFKNMILYINHMEKYKYLTAVEDQLQLVKTIETFKGYVNTNRNGEVVYVDGKPDVKSEGQANSDGNARIFNDFLRALLYEQKYPLSDSDTPLGIGKVMNFMKSAVNSVAGREIFKPEENPSATSLVKTMDAANRAFQLKTLGLEFISGAVNIFGANIQIATQAGNYFKGREVAANEIKLIGNRFKNDDERKMFVQLIDTFMPLKDDPTYDKLQKAGLTTLTQLNFADMLMVFMREPEQHIEKSIFLTLLDNMMVEDGKIVSIREYIKRKYKGKYSSAARYKEVAPNINEEIEQLKKTRSISATKKLENGKLVIPGLDMNNVEELQRLTNLTRRISRNATGGLSDSDMNRMGMSIWTKSMMIFKNWIPKLVDTRFGEFRKVSDDFSVEIGEDGLTTGEKYDIGRIRLFAYVLGTSIRDKSTNIYNILSLNDKGLETLNKMYEDFAEQYQKRTGKPLEMDREEFIDMIRTNLRNQVKELSILLSMFGAMFALGFAAPDDDDDRADKNFHRYAQRVIDKFIGELSFFYNPAEFQKILSGSAFPALGIFGDIKRFTDHTIMEMTGMDSSNPDLTVDQVRKKAQPIKNLGKMFPITKSLFTYGAIFDADFAKEFDITIQKESRR